MRRRTLQFAALAVVLVGIIVGLDQLRGRTEPTRYLSVDELMNDPARWQGEPLYVHGSVEPTSIHRAGPTDWRFNMATRGRTLSVRYTGPTPRTFEDGGVTEVSVLGELRGATFNARGLLVRVVG